MYFITQFIFEKKRNMRFFVLLWLGLLFNSCHTQSSNNINSSTEELVNESNVDTVFTLADFLAKNINLPEVKVGDYLKFINVGAYGSSMSSTYNSRPRPLEILMGKYEYRVIRSRDTLEDLCKNEIM